MIKMIKRDKKDRTVDQKDIFSYFLLRLCGFVRVWRK